MAIKILVVDDEARIRKIIGDYLKNDGYDILEAEDGKDALVKFYSNNDINLIVLDVMMPEKNGWEVCQEIREESDVPIMFLTALGTPHDEIRGLNLGADDYISKPFGYEVFMARIRSLLRRIHKDSDRVYRIHNLELDTTGRTVTLKGNDVDLSPKEFDLLVYLLDNQNIALERDKILDVVWGYDFYGDRRTIDTHIKNIRSKVGSVGACIKTVRGVGYKLEVTS